MALELSVAMINDDGGVDNMQLLLETDAFASGTERIPDANRLNYEDQRATGGNR